MKNKIMTFTRILLILLVTSILVVSVGCDKNNTTSNTQEKKTLYVFNWGDYIDPELIDLFEERYPHISVVYETFDSNDMLKTKLKAGGTSYDVIFPSDFMVSELKRENLLYELDYENIPNYKHINDRFKNLTCDSDNKYTVPYFWGTVGIMYNKDIVTEPVNSWDILWDEKYKGSVIMLDNMRDTIGTALKKLGYSSNTTNMEELQKAKEILIEQRPLVYAYYIDEIKDIMMAGEAALALNWSGPAMDAYWEGAENIGYAIPEEGSNIWVDCMVVPKTSKNKKEAEMFINFLTDPEIAYKNTEYIGYSTPNVKTYDMVMEESPELLENDAYWPSDELLNRCEEYVDLGDFKSEYIKIWNEIKIQ